MARYTLFPRRRKLESRVLELESQLRSNVNFDLTGQTLLDILAENNGGLITKKTAMKFTAVLASVSLRSGLFASFPKGIFTNRDDGGRDEDFTHPLHRVIAYQPNPYMNAFTFWELVNTHLDLWGNAYVFITRYGKEVRSLMPVDPDKVEIKVDGSKLMYEVKGTKDSVLDGAHSANKFLHFKDISFDGIIGQSRISLANDAISIAQSAENFGKTFFDKGGHSKGVIETEHPMDDESFNTFTKRWNKNVNHGTPLLDMGKKFKALTIPMEDAQFIATREFQLQDIARIFGVPSSLINDHSRSTFNNIAMIDQQFVKYGLRQMVKRYEHELENKLLGDELGKKVIRFNLDGILRGDTAARGQYYAIMKQNKILTTNEIRSIEGWNPIEGGDILENPATTSNKDNLE